MGQDFKVGTYVKFREILQEDDEEACMVVLEDRDNRVLVRSLDPSLLIPGTHVYLKEDLVAV
jgi:hypothetical protein